MAIGCKCWLKASGMFDRSPEKMRLCNFLDKYLLSNPFIISQNVNLKCPSSLHIRLLSLFIFLRCLELWYSLHDVAFRLPGDARRWWRIRDVSQWWRTHGVTCPDDDALMTSPAPSTNRVQRRDSDIGLGAWNIHRLLPADPRRCEGARHRKSKRHDRKLAEIEFYMFYSYDGQSCT